MGLRIERKRLRFWPGKRAVEIGAPTENKASYFCVSQMFDLEFIVQKEV